MARISCTRPIGSTIHPHASPALDHHHPHLSRRHHTGHIRLLSGFFQPGTRSLHPRHQPNPYAGYINIPLSIALALMLLGSNWKTRILAGLTAILLAAAEYLTQSR